MTTYFKLDEKIDDFLAFVSKYSYFKLEIQSNGCVHALCMSNIHQDGNDVTLVYIFDEVSRCGINYKSNGFMTLDLEAKAITDQYSAHDITLDVNFILGKFFEHFPHFPYLPRLKTIALKSLKSQNNRRLKV